MPVVEGDVEAVQVFRAAGGDAGHEFLRRDAFLLGRDHDRRAVGVVGADEVHDPLLAGVDLHSLITDPDVGLDVFHDVADVEGAVGVGQCGGDEQLACHGQGEGECEETNILPAEAWIARRPRNAFGHSTTRERPAGLAVFA
jgi:hypothetical protein